MGLIAYKARLSTIRNIENDSLNKEEFIPFADLETDEQMEIFEILNLTLSDVIKDRVSKGLEVSIPTICKLKIKDNNKIALDVVKETGVEDKDEIIKRIKQKKIENTNNKMLIFKIISLPK